MATSTNLVAGLSSGFDWKSMIDQLKGIEHRRVDLVTAKKTDTQTKLAEWRSVNSKLLALKTAAGKIKDVSGFDLFASSLTSSSATKAEDILTTSMGTAAADGTYALELIQTAQAQKVSGKSFTSQSAALGAPYAGSFLVNGRAVTIEATDTLNDVRNKMNSLNSGTTATQVTASIVSYSASDYRLVLSSQAEGAAGMGLQQAGAANVLEAFGFTTATTALKNATSNGAKSDDFKSSGTAVYSLLGMSGSVSGNVTINGQALTINLSSTLTEIASRSTRFWGLMPRWSTPPKTGSRFTGSPLAEPPRPAITRMPSNVLQSLGILKEPSAASTMSISVIRPIPGRPLPGKEILPPQPPGRASIPEGMPITSPTGTP